MKEYAVIADFNTHRNSAVKTASFVHTSTKLIKRHSVNKVLKNSF